MNGASKILTVSYGTFSCTLEGFDDPFNTMRAIAEYFRDLAADDRYFGAEPPTPDAAMLHRIAEREIQRRVESKIQDNGVILRAESGPMPRVTMPAVEARPAPVAVVAPSVAPAPEPTVESAAARLSRLRAAQSQILKPAPAPAPFADIASRFDDAQVYAEDQDAELIPATEPVAKATPAPPVVAAPEPVAAEPAAIPVAAQPAPAQPEPMPVAAIVEVTHPAAAAVDLATEPDAPADMISVDTAAQPEPVATPADPVAPPVDDVMASLRETLAGMIGQDDQLVEDMATASADPQIDLSVIADQIGNDDLVLSNILPADALQDFGSDDIDQPDAQDMADLAALDGVNPSPAMDEELVALAEIASEPVAQTQAVATEPAAPQPAEPDTTQTERAPVTAEPQSDLAEVVASPDAPIVAEKLQRARARVIKIRRLDTAPAITPPPVTEAEAALPDDMPLPVALPVQAELPALTPEAEAELESELAALTAEIEPAEIAPAEIAAAEGSDSIFAETADDIPGDTSVEDSLDAALAADLPILPPATLPEKSDARASVPVADDAAVDRILAQTNTELEVPETKRRRSAIAHLKAAVMATVAERRINPNANKADATVKMDPYRQDLNQAVRPTPAAAPAPERDRPAPLVLVSAQRIDRPRDLVADAQRPVPQIVPNPHPAPVQSPAAVLPVRPRRVTSSGGGATGSSALAHQVAPQRVDETMDDLTAEDLDQVFAVEGKQSFTDFAESLGATTLAELMEAAGAYCTVILAIPSFTRPQLFRQMQQIPELAEMSREDSLRGFGKLLRDGRIQKSVRGQFMLSDKSPLLTEAKRIAG